MWRVDNKGTWVRAEKTGDNAVIQANKFPINSVSPEEFSIIH